jgi:hypothetical protein
LPPDASLEQNFDQLSPDDKKAEMIKVRGRAVAEGAWVMLWVCVLSECGVTL